MLPNLAKKDAENNLTVPPLAVTLLNKISHTLNTDKVCIAGGFLRGLYMQQKLGLSPEMNDIDIFVDIAVEDFAKVQHTLEKELGIPIRYHVGQFEREQNLRGLIEFALPNDLSERCGGVKSVQLNFGLAHPLADARYYTEVANVGMNQISMDKHGQIFMSDAFISDMKNQTMTMNPKRDWTSYDWEGTKKSIDRMQKERPEFQGWKKILVNKPTKPITGKFWEACRSNSCKKEGRY